MGLMPYMTIYSGVTQRSVPITLLIGQDWESMVGLVQQKVDSCHVTWHWHLCKVTNRDEWWRTLTHIMVLGAKNAPSCKVECIVCGQIGVFNHLWCPNVHILLGFSDNLLKPWGHDHVFLSMVAAPLMEKLHMVPETEKQCINPKLHFISLCLVP